MKKKGFTLTEIIVTITIIGILALLGLNYVKKNVNRYDPLFYYQAYDALTKGFADAVAHNVTLDGEGLCNYFLTIWNVDEANSFCGPGEAVTDPGDVSFLNPNEFKIKYASKFNFNILKNIADSILALDKMIVGSAFASSVDLTGPCPPNLAQQLNEGNTMAQEGMQYGCSYTIDNNGNTVWQPSLIDNPQVYTHPIECDQYSHFVEPDKCLPNCNCLSYNHYIGIGGDFATTFYSYCSHYQHCSYQNTDVQWSTYCSNQCCQNAHLCANYSCDCDGFNLAQAQSNMSRFYNLCGHNLQYWIVQCATISSCNCTDFKSAVAQGTVSAFISACGHDLQYWENKCPDEPTPNCDCSGYSAAVAQGTVASYLSSCGNNAEYWENLCGEEPPPVPEETDELIGIIKTQYGLIFEFYSNITFTLGQDASGNDVNLTYFKIKVSKQGNDTLMPVYFIVYPATQELFPASPELVDNKTVLPAFLSSDFNNHKNSPVTKYTTYRSARCEKETKDPVSNNYIIPPSHAAYTHFVNANNLSSLYLTDYCSDNNHIIWLDNEAKNAPRSSLEVKTAPPNGMR